MGPNLAQLLTSYWDWQRIVTKTVKFLGKDLRTGRGLIQGDPASPMIFNIVMGAVVQSVHDVVCISQEGKHGLVRAAGERNLIFYANNGRIVGWDHKWVQDALLATVGIFRKMNWEKTLRRQMP